MATSRGMTTTQQSELLKLFRKQLVDVCGMSLLQIFQKTVLGYDSENKVRDVSSLEIEALHEIIQISRTSSSHQNQFKRRLQEDFVCKDLPTIICNLIRSEIQFLNIRGACVPQEPISILWNFLLRKSFEYPILLHTKDDKVGTIVELFKQKCLEVFDAECLLPNICGAADNNMTTTFNHNKNNNNSSNFGAMNPQLQEQAKQLVLQSSMLDENLLFLGKKKRTE